MAATGDVTPNYPKPRTAQGLDSIKGARFPSAEENSEHTILMPRKNTAAADPTIQPMAPARPFAPYQGEERNGASYGIRVGFQASTAPEAGNTLANGRLFKAAISRQAPNFGMGTQDYN